MIENLDTSEPASTTATFVTVEPANIPDGSPCRLLRPLLLLRREHNGEIWVTCLIGEWDEYGVGATTAEAVDNLWDSLCRDFNTLEESENHLSPKLKSELQALRLTLQRR